MGRFSLRRGSRSVRPLTAYNSGGDPQGLRTALTWFSVGFPLVIFYFVVVFRLHRGKVVPAAEADGH